MSMWTPGTILRRESKELLKALLPSGALKTIQRLRPTHRRVITTSAELDAMVRAVDEAFSRSEAEGLKTVDAFEFRSSISTPARPDSALYLEAQMELYRLVSGRPGYHVLNERSPIDVEAAARRPFPYATGDLTVVGDQLLAIGFLCRTLALPPGSRVVEFGPGWGNTTLALVQSGFHVTAVEVDEAFIRLLERRAAWYADSLRLVHTDMLSFAPAEMFDAAIFFESFHHCADHRSMLERLRRMVRPGGFVVFAAEPIAPFPFPWGLRLDGQSIYSMRKHGWLELGFDTDYFLQTLKSMGFSVKRHQARSISSLCDVFVARNDDP